MKLTKNQRETIYCMLLAEIDEPLFAGSKDFGICFMLDCLFDCYTEWPTDYCDKIEYDLPELWAQRPARVSDGGAHWYRDGLWTERKQCILNALKALNRR